MNQNKQLTTLIGAAFLLIGLPLLWMVYLLSSTTFHFDPEAAKAVTKTGIELSFGETEWWYLMINIGAVIFPFLLSFDKKVHFYKKWKYLFPAIILVAAFFIVWDVWFTHLGVWGFNPPYINFMIMGLPLGEWLFFVTVPYCCVFVHECLLCYFPQDPLKRYDRLIGGLLIGLLLAIGLANIYKAYTAWAFLLAGGFLAFHQNFIPNTYRTRFYIAYLICLIPFTLINGILTGGFNKEPVVLYNDAHNLASSIGSRFISIPYDDFAYGFLLILMTITIYETLKRRRVR
jgi:lycopene cyclase domain-containing protein